MAQLSPVTSRFVVHWGEMGTRWGVNRTVAQIHALLYVSAKPLTAEDIAETLGVARSNVSNSLHELQSWGIVKIVHVLGDRRDHFESMQDVWTMFRLIMEERRRREVDPTLTVLRECVAAAEKSGAAEAHARQRIGNMLEFFETTTTWCQQIAKLPDSALSRFMKLGAKIPKLLGLS